MGRESLGGTAPRRGRTDVWAGTWMTLLLAVVVALLDTVLLLAAGIALFVTASGDGYWRAVQAFVAQPTPQRADRAQLWSWMHRRVVATGLVTLAGVLALELITVLHGAPLGAWLTP